MIHLIKAVSCSNAVLNYKNGTLQVCYARGSVAVMQATQGWLSSHTPNTVLLREHLKLSACGVSCFGLLD
jgi:hypothetical protein